MYSILPFTKQVLESVGHAAFEFKVTSDNWKIYSLLYVDAHFDSLLLLEAQSSTFQPFCTNTLGKKKDENVFFFRLLHHWGAFYT